MQCLINHKPDIEQIFAIKIITNKNMFDAYIILIYVKNICLRRNQLVVFNSDLDSSVGEKEY